MVKFVRNVVILLLVCLAPAAQTFAQLHPMPGSKSESPVLCTGCIGNNYFGQANDGLKTYPYSGAIKNHVGRYTDSTSTASFQAPFGFRTARARQILTAPKQRGTAPPRVYVVIGSAIAAYRLDAFFTQMLPGEMVSVKSVKSGIKIGGFGRTPPEDVLMWDGMVYPDATTSGWFVPFQDKQDNIGTGSPMDVDDRGYLYAAYTYTGWGIVKDDGRSDNTHFPTIVQLLSGGGTGLTKEDSSGVDPESVISIKVGSKYYAITGSGTKEAVWDVTDPASPRWISTRSGNGAGIRRFDRNDDTEHVAVLNGRGQLRVYTYSSFVAGGTPTPIYENAASFADLAYDESGNLWAAEKTSNIWKLTRSGNSYSAASFSPHAGKFDHLAMHVSAGHIFVQGKDYSGTLAYDGRLLKIESGALRNIDLDGFFRNYYHNAPADHAQPAGYTNPEVMGDVQIVKSGGKTYLMYSTIGLGDVFEIEGEDTISIKVKNNTFGTPNPNSKGTAGPYPGDIVTFTAPASNPQVIYDVTWDFGNPESADNTGLKKSNVEFPHQYTGLNTSAKITSPKLVRAITVQSSQIAANHSLTLKVPTPRIGITGVTEPITANATGVQVLAGQTFNDASDGSVEGHYSSWTIDGVETKLAPNQTISAGAVGPHTLSFQGAYGKYDGAFNSTSPYLTTPITVSYVAKPFVVSLKTPTKIGTDVKFSATALKATDGSITAQVWDVTWKKNGTPIGAAAANGIATNASVTAGTVPDLTVPMSSLADGDVISVTIDVATADLSTAAQPYAQAVATMTLSKPDPKITKTGCDNAGNPCTFTASSISSASIADWTFAWTLKKSGAVFKTGNTNPFTPAITEPGSYTIELVATKAIFDTPATSQALTVEASLCQPLPPAYNVSITVVGCSAGCPPGTKVTFWPTMMGYSAQECDTFAWTFGSGEGTGTGEQVEHTYNSSGTFTVTLKITNPNGTLTKTTSLTVTGGNNGGGTPTTCTAPTAAAISYSGCSTGGCKTTDTMSFSARRGSLALQSCDSVKWSFGDGTTSSTRTPTKKYANPGTYTVTMYIENTKGTSPTDSEVITVTQGTSSGGGTCSTAPGPGNFAITLTGPESGCTYLNGQDCKVGEAIAFDSQDYYYAPAACDHFEWDFGDGSAKVGTRAATHSYASANTYPVKLRVYNNLGEWTYTKSLKIGGGVAAKPVPTLSATTFPTTGVKGKSVTFTASSNMALTTGWTWTVTPLGGAPTVDSSQAGHQKQVSSMSYTFPNKGKYTVKVTARNAEDAANAPVGAVQASIDIAEPPPGFSYLLPAVAHAGGLNSNWRTDVQIYTPQAVTEGAPLKFEVTFKGKTYPLEMPASTKIYKDFLFELVGRSDQGPVVITTTNATVPPSIWTRTYNQTDEGTFGQFIPAVRIDAGGSGGAVGEGHYYLAGLRHDSRYRTNLGFVNPTDSPIAVKVNAFDDRNAPMGPTVTLDLHPFQLVQFAVNQKFQVGDTPFSLEIEAPDGKWVYAYASFIDGRSNDPVFLEAVRASELRSADYRTILVPGVGHLNTWRSDVTIYYPPSLHNLTVDLAYYDQTGAKKAEALSVFVRGGEFLQYDDLLKQGVLGSVDDSFGLLKITVPAGVTPDQFPMAFSRTYSDDGAGKTYGQGIPGFSAARGNVTAAKPALIPGVRNDADYRTDLNVSNTSDAPAIVTIRLLDPTTGASYGTPSQHALLAYQSVKLTDVDLGGKPYASVKFEVVGGNVWGYASIIDRKTNDAEYVPAMPQP